MSSLTNQRDVYANVVSTDFLYVNGAEITAEGMIGPPGSIAQSYEGAWSSTVYYLPNDVVVYGGSSYVALAPNTNSTPSLDNPLWGVLAVVGGVGPASTVPGPPGADSTVPGPPGPQGLPGADSTVPGPQGPPGEDASVITTFRDIWSATTSYARGDIIIYSENNDGIYSCYLCLTSNTNQVPPSPGNTSTYWTFLATHGAQGEQGPRGWTGATGPQGDTGPAGKDGQNGSDGISPVLDIAELAAIILEGVVIAGLIADVNLMKSTTIPLIAARVLALEQNNLLNIEPAISSLNTKTQFQASSATTLTTEFGGTSLVKISGNGLSSAVSLNASTASTFSLGAIVNGGLTADQVEVAGAMTAPGFTISANGLTTNIGSGLGSRVNIGNTTQLSSIYINGRVYLPSRDAELDSWGFAKTNGFLSQF